MASLRHLRHPLVACRERLLFNAGSKPYGAARHQRRPAAFFEAGPIAGGIASRGQCPVVAGWVGSWADQGGKLESATAHAD